MPQTATEESAFVPVMSEDVDVLVKEKEKGIVVGSPFLSSVRLTIRIIMFLCHFKSTV